MPDNESAERRLLTMIPAAQAGDQQAVAEICCYVFHRWHARVARYYHADPALDREDIDSAFWEGIWRGIAKLDERGNPLYHLGQRGVWNVMSTLRAVERMRFGVAHDVQVVSLDDQLVQYADDGEEPGDAVVRVEHARQRVVHMVARTQLRGTSRRLLDLMLAGRADPTEKGFVKGAAQQLGVSPQRVSQCMHQLRSDMAQHDPDSQ